MGTERSASPALEAFIDKTIELAKGRGYNPTNLPSTSPSAAECLFLGVPIQPEDVGLLCVHFQPMNEHREDRPTP